MEKIKNNDLNNLFQFDESGKTLFLSSFLNESAFGKTDLINFLEKPSYTAEFDADGKNFTLEEWKFEGTKTDSNGNVFFTGSFSGKETLSDIFNGQENGKHSASEVKEKCSKVLRIITEFIKNSKSEEFIIPGAAGFVFSSLADGKEKILMIDGALLERVALNSKNYGEIQGIFMRKGLEPCNSALFTRSVIAYRALAGKFPFTEKDLEKRQHDIFDRNFTPIQYLVEGIDGNLSNAINEGLCVSEKKRVVPGERRFISEKETKKRKTVIENAGKFDIDLFDSSVFSEKTNEEENETTSPTQFDIARMEFEKKQNRRVKKDRFFRTYRNTIIGAVAVFIIAVSALLSFHETNSKLATSLGLDSFDTVQTLYTGIHTADVPLIQEITKGKKMKSMIQIISGFHVTNTQRFAMNQSQATLSPAQWLFFGGNTEFWQYGITDFKIDGTAASTDFKYPVRKDKMKSIKETDPSAENLSLKRGDTKIHNAEYNLIYHDGEQIMTVSHVNETVTLTWDGKKWLVTEVYGPAKNNSYRLKVYKEDLMNSLEEAQNDILLAAEKMAEKYNFMPRPDEIKNAAVTMAQKYNNSAAKKLLEDD